MDSNAVKLSPLVSVLMTAYNREQYIAEAIESVIASSYINFELIIVDDCSIDNTVEIAKSYEAKDNRIKVYVNEVNLGDYPNRNRAASYAKGKYLKYVDSDDMISYTALKIMVDAMETHPEASLVIASLSNENLVILDSKTAYEEYFLIGNYGGFLDFGPSFTLIKAEQFFNLGGFFEIRNVSDGDMWLRLAAQYQILLAPIGLINYRRHSNQEYFLAPQMYVLHNYAITKKNLMSEFCPISKKLVYKILTKRARSLKFSLLKELIKTGDMNLFKKAWKSNGLGIFRSF